MAKLERNLVQVVQEQSMVAAKDWFRGRISSKLEVKGITGRPKLVDALVDHFLSKDGGETFRWAWTEGEPDQDLDLDIEFTSEDECELDELLSRLRKAVPLIVRDAHQELVDDFFSALKKAWPGIRASTAEADAGFRERLERRWGEAFDLLRMMHYAAWEMGREAHKGGHWTGSRRGARISTAS
jgi:hypothetical protein